MTKETITALMLAPGLQPMVTEVYRDLNFIQKAVSIGAEDLCSVGKISLDFLKLGCAEYEKRLRPFLKLVVTEIEEQRQKGEGSTAEQAVIEAEGDRILKLLERKNCEKAALCVEGKKMDSISFSRYLSDSSVKKSGIVFVIGGSLGLSQRVKDACDLKLSISDMTFTHQFARLLLMEQIYRGTAILNGIKYHK